MKRVLTIFILVATTAAGFTLYGPLIDPSPMGAGVDGGRPVALVGGSDGMLAVWADGPEGDLHDIYRRAVAFNGIPLRQAREYVGTGSLEAAASNGTSFLIAWSGEDVRVQIYDSEGLPFSDPVIAAGEVTIGDSVLTSIDAVGLGHQWRVFWTRRQQIGSEIQNRIEGVFLTPDGQPIGSPSVVASNARLLAAASLSGDTVALAMQTDSEVRLSRIVGNQIVDSRTLMPIPAGAEVRDTSMVWKDEKLVLAVLLEDRFDHTQSVRQAVVRFDGSSDLIGPPLSLEQRCSAISADLMASTTILSCGQFDSSPYATETHRLSLDGTVMGVEHSLFGLGSGAIFVRDSKVWTLTTTERTGIQILRLDGRNFEIEATLSNRAANTFALPWIEEWDAETKLLLWTEDGRIRANLATHEGLILPAPVVISMNPFSEIRLARHGTDIYIAGANQRCIATGCTLEIRIWRLDTLALFPVPVSQATLEIPGPLSLTQMASGPAGLLLRLQFTAGSPTGRLLLLDHDSLAIKFQANTPERASDSEGLLVFDDRLIVISGDPEGARTADVYDASLQVITRRRLLADASMGLENPVLSRRGDLGLIAWVDSSARVRSLVVDPNASVVGGSVVTAAFMAEEPVSVEPSGSGWHLGWLSRGAPCEAGRVELGLEGQPLGPAEFERLDIDCDRISFIDPLAPWVVWQSTRRPEQPWGNVHRALIGFAPAEDDSPQSPPRRRGVRHP
ncbi:MAG: hypothetical protein KY459_00770 [Acidobacteria bacterium]|nr:hypothetical protein [Acidobacteriota bacterium]